MDVFPGGAPNRVSVDGIVAIWPSNHFDRGAYPFRLDPDSRTMGLETGPKRRPGGAAGDSSVAGTFDRDAVGQYVNREGNHCSSQGMKIHIQPFEQVEVNHER